MAESELETRKVETMAKKLFVVILIVLMAMLSGEAGIEVQAGTDLHAAGAEQDRRTAGVVSIIGRHELAGTSAH